MSPPPTWIVNYALELAAQSPCRSRRGVVVYARLDAPPPPLGEPCAVTRIYGAGYNGPPRGFACPGRGVCTGTCGQRSVHAEMRALRALSYPGQLLDLVHVELGADGGVVACDGPRCVTCSREIADVGAIGRVWLYEASAGGPAWRSYTAEEFHRATLIACGLEAR